jgi:hypothetical protein
VWTELAATLAEQQLIQATMLVGYYTLVSFTLNAFRTPLEEGATSFEAHAPDTA